MLVTPTPQMAAFGEHISMRPFFLVLLVSNPKCLRQGAAGTATWAGSCGDLVWHPLGTGTRATSLLLAHPLGQYLTEGAMLVPLRKEIAEELNKREVLHLVP